MKISLTLAALLATTVALPAHAATLVYNLSGTISGTYAGNGFTANATFSGKGDTSAPGTAFGNPTVTSVTLSNVTGVSGGQSFDVTSPVFFYIYAPSQYGSTNTRLGFSFDGTGSNALGLESAAFNGYTGLTAFQNTAGTTYFQNASFSSSAGQVVINSFEQGSFSAGAVPEPTTWAMMFAGFGVMGFGLRSRRSRSTTVTFA